MTVLRDAPGQGLSPDRQTHGGHGPLTERKQGGGALPSSQETGADTAQWGPSKSSDFSVPKFPQRNMLWAIQTQRTIQSSLGICGELVPAPPPHPHPPDTNILRC